MILVAKTTVGIGWMTAKTIYFVSTSLYRAHNINAYNNNNNLFFLVLILIFCFSFVRLFFTCVVIHKSSAGRQCALLMKPVFGWRLQDINLEAARGRLWRLRVLCICIFFINLQTYHVYCLQQRPSNVVIHFPSNCYYKCNRYIPLFSITQTFFNFILMPKFWNINERKLNNFVTILNNTSEYNSLWLKILLIN